MRAILVNQFSRLRDGDPLYFERSLSSGALRDVQNTTLADIMQRDTEYTNYQNNVFFFRASVGGIVFGDTNGNGRMDNNEHPLANMRVELVNIGDGNALVASSHTNGFGRFQFSIFDGVRSGQYQIWVVDSGGNTIAMSPTVAVTRGEQFPFVNIGIQPQGRESGQMQSGPSTSDMNVDLGSFDLLSDSSTGLLPRRDRRG